MHTGQNCSFYSLPYTLLKKSLPWPCNQYILWLGCNRFEAATFLFPYYLLGRSLV